jgi:hypothetical protein
MVESGLIVPARWLTGEGAGGEAGGAGVAREQPDAVHQAEGPAGGDVEVWVEEE